MEFRKYHRTRDLKLPIPYPSEKIPLKKIRRTNRIHCSKINGQLLVCISVLFLIGRRLGIIRKANTAVVTMTRCGPRGDSANGSECNERRQISPSDRRDTSPNAWELTLPYPVDEGHKEYPENDQQRDLNESLTLLNGQNTPHISPHQIGCGDRNSDTVENLIRKGEGDKRSYIGCQIEYL